MYLSQVADFFMGLAEEELSISVTKKVLNDKIDFAPASLHSHVANEELAITPKNIYDFMKRMSVPISYDSAFKLVCWVGKSSITSISMKEFMDFVCCSEYWESLINKRANIEVTHSILFLLGKLITKEIAIIKMIEEFREKVTINVYTLFYAINKDGKKYISDNQIADFIKGYSKKPFITRIALCALVKRLDMDNDGAIGLLDLLNLLSKYPIHGEVCATPNKEKTKLFEGISPIKSVVAKNIQNTNNVRKVLAYSMDGDLFSVKTTDMINRLSQDVKKFRNNKNDHTKAEALRTLQESKAALDKSFMRIIKLKSNANTGIDEIKLGSEQHNILTRNGSDTIKEENSSIPMIPVNKPNTNGFKLECKDDIIPDNREENCDSEEEAHDFPLQIKCKS